MTWLDFAAILVVCLTVIALAAAWAGVRRHEIDKAPRSIFTRDAE